MQQVLESALDKLASPRASLKAQENALNILERNIAELVLPESDGKQNNLNQFLQLQDSFQCNFASRMSPWLSYRASELRKLKDQKGSSSTTKEDEYDALATLITQALSILQGVVLLHKPSKDFLSRKNSLEVFVDLLFIYRHATTKSYDSSKNSSPNGSYSVDQQQWHTAFASAILDTLLCILVDSPSAIRVFEELRGVEHIVKVLKRATIPKDIRIKCLEFLYFYLMDESSPGYKSAKEETPTRVSTPAKPLSRISAYQDSRISSSSSGTPSSQSSGSRSSTASFASFSPTPTLAGTPPLTPRSSARKVAPVRGPLEMLRKEVDFVPLSPKRAKVARLGVGQRRPGAPPLSPLKFSGGKEKRHPSPLGRLPSEETMYSETDTDVSLSCRSSLDGEEEFFGGSPRHIRTRTTEEKKEILGQLLGNVDALVEGVRNAGIWGLGG